MKPLNNSSLPRENFAPGKLFTRRNFLKLAGATAVALPFMKPEEALGSVDNSTFHRGCNYADVHHYTEHNIHVSGVRHYGVQPSHKHPDAGGVPTVWPTRVNNCRVCFTVYPKWNTFWHGGKKDGYDSNFKELFRKSLYGDQITVFQEPENIDWHSDGVKMTADRIRTIQNRMLEIKHSMSPVPFVAIGAIGFHQWYKARDYMAFGLDFYAVDLYRTEFDKQQAIAVLNEYHRGILRDNKADKQRPISVCECNAHDYIYRPCYFRAIAHWIANQSYDSAFPTRCFHTFWRKDGKSSGPFLDGDTNTISALRDIGNSVYTVC